MKASVCLPPDQLEAEEAWIEGDDYRHLFRSRRLQVGDEVRVTDGRGRQRRAEVAAVERHRALVRNGSELESIPVVCELRLFVATPRKERASWLVEKATELGVVELVFFRSKRTVRPLGDGARSRLLRVATSAMLQSGGDRLPRIGELDAVDGLVDRLGRRQADHRLYVPSPGARRSLWAAAAQEAPVAASVVVGPEGGLTDSEERRLARVGGETVGLGSKILRVETAAVCAAALLLTRDGRDW